SSLLSRQLSPFFPYTTLFRSKVALITGSDSGIGRAIALAYAGEGAKVVVTYRSDEDGGRRTTEDIRAQGGEAICLQLDVTDEAQDRKSTRLNSSHVKISYAVF